jgi:hypothetical protein
MTLATALPVASGVSVSAISGEVTRGDPIFPWEFLPHIALCFEFQIQGGFQKMEPTRDMRLVNARTCVMCPKSKANWYRFKANGWQGAVQNQW